MLNAVGAYVGWWACLVGASRGWTWVGPAVVLSLAVVAVGTAPNRGRAFGRIRLMVAAAATGYVFDSALVVFGILTFPEHARLGGPSALWMVALWVNLALTLDASMDWLRGRYVLGAFAGAVSGPLAYASGAQLGAAVLGPSTWVALALVSAEWTVALPLLLWVADRTVFAPQVTAGTEHAGRQRHVDPNHMSN